MRTYASHIPTQFDRHITLRTDDDTDREAWIVLGCGRNRDSGPSAESNFASALAELGGEGENVEVHRFGHWACGWYETILVRPGTPEETIAEDIESRLAAYPILDEADLDEREREAAAETWRVCYRDKDRIEYMRKYANEFEFHSFADMLGCARGRWFGGDASRMAGSDVTP